MLASTFALALAGCAVDEGDIAVEDGAASTELKADHLTVQFKSFTDDTGNVGQRETRYLITSAASYKAIFGHAAPFGVDFRTEWVFFYSAGVRNSGGYEASVKQISLSSTGRSVYFDTQLSSPGPNCIVTWAFTKPHVLVKFPKPSRVRNAYSSHENVTRDCSEPTLGCATVLCAPNTHCIEDVDGPRCVCSLEGLCVEGYVWSEDTCKCEPAPAGCRADSDCKLWDNYCGGCQCLAIGVNESGPRCSNPVNCFAQPCGFGQTAACVNGACVVQPGTR